MGTLLTPQVCTHFKVVRQSDTLSSLLQGSSLYFSPISSTFIYQRHFLHSCCITSKEASACHGLGSTYWLGPIDRSGI